MVWCSSGEHGGKERQKSTVTICSRRLGEQSAKILKMKQKGTMGKFWRGGVIGDGAREGMHREIQAGG